ncbi:MAG: pitrilysin family protein [Bryobacteraceae bacterium]
MSKLLISVIVAAVLAAGADGDLPRHPRDLKFQALTYQPPRAADHRHKLSNGAVAFLVEDHDLPLVQISVMVRTGAYLEPPGKVGLAQLTGSQMRSGGTKSKPPAVFDEEAAFLAANISSSISDLQGQASLNCLAKDLDAGLALLVDMMRNPGFAEDRLTLAKSQALQSMERRNDSTPGIESREFTRLMRGDKHFTALPTTKASVESITRDDLAAFHSRYYYPGNFIFAVSGDFKTSEMLAKLEKAFGGWPNRTDAIPEVPKPQHTPQPGIYLVNKKEVNQGRVRMGHLGVTMDNPDHLAITVMNSILGGGGFTSRITSRVRSDEGLAYQAGSIFQHGTYYEGTFGVVFQSKSPTVAQAITIVSEEIDRIRREKVTGEELQTEVSLAIESFPRRFATAGAKAGQFAQDYFTKRPEDYWEKYRGRLRALTPDKIQGVAQKYLHPDKLVILAVGDVDTILKGNPDKPEYTFAKLGGGREPVRIPLPDPLTMMYP